MRRAFAVTAALTAAGMAAGTVGCAGSRGRPAPDDAHAPSGGAEAGGQWVEAHVPQAANEIARLDAAIRLFARDRAGRIPARLDELVAEKNPEGDSYLRALPTDPWGRPFSYAVVSARRRAYDLRSYGPDGLPGTDDDVLSIAGPVPLDSP